jgi:adenylate cyclase
MIWNTIAKKINYLFLLGLTETIRLIVRFFLKDAEFFLQRYPLLTAEPAVAWHYFRLSVGEIVEYAGAKRPLFIKLAVFFSVLIGFGVISLGSLIGFNQAQTLQNQATRFNQVLAAQAAHVLETPVLLNNKADMAMIVINIMQETMIAGVIIYADDYAIIESYGVNNTKPVSPVQEIEYSQMDNGLAEVMDNMLGKVKRVSRYTIPIKHEQLVLGYLSLSFDYANLEAIRVETLHNIIAITLITLIIAFMAAFYVSSLLFKPLNDLLVASEAVYRINLGEDKHDAKNKFVRKDELQVLMESMNQMNKGLLQKDKVEAFFSRYVSAQVANQVLKDLDNIESVKLGGEHVMASVFFADIVGFTSLSESLQPQEISELLNEYFSKIIEVVSFCNGHVDKFIGDCAMVVFGVPERNKHHAFSCVACAWMILQLVEQLNDKREAEGAVTVEFRIGANSGMMLAGNMGSTERMEYTVVGDSVNLASRLSGTGEPGELIITEDVFIEQGLEGTVQTEIKDLIKIRGKKLPVKILNVKDILTPFKEQMLNEIPRIIAGETKK